MTLTDSYSDLLEYLAPIADVLLDPSVSDILVNADRRVFVEREGRKTELAGIHLDEQNVRAAVRRIARTCHSEIDEDRPILDARLADGSRICAVFPPASHGVLLSIRKFSSQIVTLERLVLLGGISPMVRQVLSDAIERCETLLISGATGAGKTTLLSALAARIPTTERIGLIESPSEIHIEHPNVFRLEGSPTLSVAELLRTALRLAPDRLIVGEVRGPEAADLLQALNTGHAGSLSTIHANSATLAISRLTRLALSAQPDSGSSAYRLIQRDIADAIQWIVQLSKLRDGNRRVVEVVRLRGFSPDRDLIVLEPFPL